MIKDRKFSCIIAVDAMGGDLDPHSSINGMEKLLCKYPNIKFNIFGDESKISSLISKTKLLKKSSNIVHTEFFVDPKEKPSAMLRHSKNTSMRLAIESVKDGTSDAIVSSGNTGALMVISRSVLRTLPTIDRPAITAMIPTTKDRPVILVDAGANAECNEQNLYEFAIMGSALAKILFAERDPTVGLLNIGSEDMKGTEFIKKAMMKLSDAKDLINLKGFVEGDDMLYGAVDVIVTDGFTGNVALKTIEGTAKFCEHYIKKGFTSSIFAKIGYLFARRSMKSTFIKIDKRSYNGAMLVGLNGIVVKSHGSSDDVGFYYALDKTVDLIKNNINKKITDTLSLKL